MLLQIHPLQMEQAELLKSFVVPEVWEMPERNQFWYLAALEEMGKIIGGIVVDPRENGAELMSIAVAPAYHRLGVATELLDYTKEMLLSAGVETIQMTMSQSFEEWKGFEGFLERNEFALSEQERYTYQVRLADVAVHPLLCTMQLPESVVAVEKLSGMEMHNLFLRLSEVNVDPVVVRECNQALSFVWRGKEQIEAVFLMSDLQDGIVHNLWTWLSQKANNPKALMALFAAFAQKAGKEYQQETMLEFTCLEESGDRLMHYFLPGIEPALSLRTYICSTAQRKHEKAEDKILKEKMLINGEKPDRSGYWADMEPNIVEEAALVCTSCEYCIKGKLLECVRYEWKPGCVFYGAPCEFFKKNLKK